MRSALAAPLCLPRPHGPDQRVADHVGLRDAVAGAELPLRLEPGLEVRVELARNPHEESSAAALAVASTLLGGLLRCRSARSGAGPFTSSPTRPSSGPRSSARTCVRAVAVRARTCCAAHRSAGRRARARRGPPADAGRPGDGRRVGRRVGLRPAPPLGRGADRRWPRAARRLDPRSPRQEDAVSEQEPRPAGDASDASQPLPTAASKPDAANGFKRAEALLSQVAHGGDWRRARQSRHQFCLAHPSKSHFFSTINSALPTFQFGTADISIRHCRKIHSALPKTKQAIPRIHASNI